MVGVEVEDKVEILMGLIMMCCLCEMDLGVCCKELEMDQCLQTN